MNHVAAAVAFSAVLSMSMRSFDASGDPNVPQDDAAHAARILSGKPVVVPKTRLPDVKLLDIIDANTVLLRTDRVIIERLKGQGLYADGHKPPDSITLRVGGRCRIGAGRQWQDLHLLKIDGKSAIFHREAHGRREGPSQEIDEVVSVAGYRDAEWRIDPQDPTRFTYTEFDVQGKKILEKHFKNDKLDGELTRWYPNGTKEALQHYKNGWREGTWLEWHPNGVRQRETHFLQDVAVGRETWWNPEGRPSAFEEHPVRPRPNSETDSRK
jgi:hypothetical protein